MKQRRWTRRLVLLAAATLMFAGCDYLDDEESGDNQNDCPNAATDEDCPDDGGGGGGGSGGGGSGGGGGGGTIGGADCSDPIELSGSVEEQTTLTAGSCYQLDGRLNIRNGGHLVIEPGVTVLMEQGANVRVQEGSALIATGTADDPIIFTGLEAAEGYWGEIRFRRTASPENVMDHVIVEYGEGVRVNSRSSDPSRVSITNTTIQHNTGYGLEVDRYSNIDAFSNNTITNNEVAVKASGTLVGVFTTDSTYSGNENDYFVIDGDARDYDQVWQNLGIPYRVDGRLNVRSTIEIEAGSTFLFDQGSRIRVREDGRLAALGTENERITFRGYEEAPGYWDGVHYRRTNSTDNKLQHVDILHGGTSIDANLYVQGRSSDPARLELSDVRLMDGSAYGLRITNHVNVTCDDVTTHGNEGGPANIDAEITCPVN